MKLKLISYIRNQNLARVKECCALLPKNIFTDTEESPLQLAASLPDTEILRVVYDHDPEQYDILLQNKCFCSPLFLAGYHREQNNLEFLLQQTRTFTKRDIVSIDTHILEGPASNPTEKSYKVIKYLLDNGVDIGNEFVELYKNPMARCVIRGDDWSQKIVALMLPLADYRSKYLAILSTTCELYYEYGRNKQPSNFVVEPGSRIDKLQKIRNAILCSLTSAECKQINNFSHHYSCNGVYILEDDLNHELAKAQTEDQTQLVTHIQCFLTNRSTAMPSTEISSQLCEHSDENLPEKPGNTPPNDDNKLKILLILTTLKDNIEHKKHGRAVWFTQGTENKLRQLKQIETWLTDNSLDNGNESVILRQIRDVCVIKRNTLGFFQPHSLVEYKKLLTEHQLIFPDWQPVP